MNLKCDVLVSSLCVFKFNLYCYDEAALKDAFYAYGELKSIRCVHSRNCAFVTYTEREVGAAQVQFSYKLRTLLLITTGLNPVVTHSLKVPSFNH